MPEMIAELDQGKLPDQLKFFEDDRSEKDLLLQKMRKNIGNLSKFSLEFLDYLSSDYGKELLHKSFSQRDLEYYLNEILSGTTDDRFELLKNGTAKFLFHRFDNFWQSFGLSKSQLRHSQVDYVFKALQNKNWAYFIKTLLEVSNDQVDISSFSNPNELSILSQTSENQKIKE